MSCVFFCRISVNLSLENSKQIKMLLEITEVQTIFNIFRNRKILKEQTKKKYHNTLKIRLDFYI